MITLALDTKQKLHLTYQYLDKFTVSCPVGHILLKYWEYIFIGYIHVISERYLIKQTFRCYPLFGAPLRSDSTTHKASKHCPGRILQQHR